MWQVRVTPHRTKGAAQIFKCFKLSTMQMTRVVELE